MSWKCRGLLASGEPGIDSVFAGALLRALDRREGSISQSYLHVCQTNKPHKFSDLRQNKECDSQSSL